MRSLAASAVVVSLFCMTLVGCPDADPVEPPSGDAAADVVTDQAGDTPATDTPAPDTPGDAGPNVVTCSTYCATVQAACTNDDAQYTSEAECLSVCSDWAGWDSGSEGEQSGNTIACRLYHATAATGPEANATSLHCPHAGPSGGNVCGTWCDNYCALSARNCTDTHELYASEAVCTAACANFNATAPVGITDGNSVQCRIYHLQVAGSDPPDSSGVHCPHGSEDGGGVCSDPEPTCANYCAAVTDACTGENAAYGSEQACLDYCNTFGQLPEGTAGATDGNSIACRLYHAGVAATSDANAAIHCPHAGPTGGDVCGSWCTNYCHLATANCTGTDAIYANADDCTVACATMDATGFIGDVDGDSVQCRIYHLGVAGDSASGGAATHCPHGSQDGGGQCVKPDPSCQLYCDKVMANCSDTNAQYTDAQACLDHCNTYAGWDLGTSVDETSGNTVACRIYHATVAKGDPVTHCDHAGPSGGNACGNWCTNYCYLAEKNCTGANELYADSDACAVACTAFSDTGSANDVDGDTVQCRIYHLGVAGNSSAGGGDTHCSHGGPDGGDVCVDAAPVPGDCATYCTAITASCTGANAQYASEQECLDYCNTGGALPLGLDSDTSGNTVGCRTYHANVAATENPELHCAHAGPSGGNVCGSWCENYCHLSDTNCTGGDAITFASDCATDCAAYLTFGAPGDAAGNNVQCRIYHLGAAAGDAGFHCPHGAPDGGGVCVGGEPATPTYDADVQPILGAKCIGCHTGGNSGSHNIGNTYADASKSTINAQCSGLTVGECTIVRIQSGQMPAGAGCTGDPAQDTANAACLTQAEQDTLQAWIDGGLPEN